MGELTLPLSHRKLLYFNDFIFATTNSVVIQSASHRRSLHENWQVKYSLGFMRRKNPLHNNALMRQRGDPVILWSAGSTVIARAQPNAGRLPRHLLGGRA
jgi:hypothetical protein